jgi:TfoX/Sxy family transcriptional regulator of competence genes/GNAT superfamily N-acetyltransferase
MATDATFIAYICEQADMPRRLTFKKMFGEYALYVDGKVIAFVCDNQLFLKPLEEVRSLLGTVTELPAYPGSKLYFRISDELDDRDALRRLFNVTADALPLPKPKAVAAKTAVSKKIAKVVTQAPSALTVTVRPIQKKDKAAWQPLWDGYNAFYGRHGKTALSPDITRLTWQRFFDAKEPVFGLVAVRGGKLIGLTHYLFHRSTTRAEMTCYLQDLFTLETERGQGVGRALIAGVVEKARAEGVKRVYWQTHETNAAGRLLYDKVGKHAGFIVYAHDL